MTVLISKCDAGDGNDDVAADKDTIRTKIVEVEEFTWKYTLPRGAGA